MKVISIWNPYATLIVQGFKSVETRTWDAPKSLIGKRIAIASTKTIRPEQRALYEDPGFMEHFSTIPLPALQDMPNGAILGSAILHSSSVITEEDLEDVTEQEQAFGNWQLGSFAWRLRSPLAFASPIFTRGFQGIWDHDLESEGEDQARPADRRRDLHLVKG